MERLRPELITELACATPDRSEFERGVLGLLERRIGADVGFFCGAEGVSDVAFGLDSRIREPARQRWPEMAREVARLRPAAERCRWAVVDSECFGRELERLVYYDTVMRPHYGRTTLMGFLRCHGRHIGIVVLGRNAGSSSFRSREVALLGEVLPMLSLSRKSYAERQDSPRGEAVFALTPREREVCSYLRLGYTNQEIALALGSAPRTVRNQLSRVYEKLGVSGRAEAVAAFHGTIVPSTDRSR